MWNAIHFFAIPGSLAFTYVQTMLLITQVFAEYLSGEKNMKYYNAIAVIISLPISIMAWGEGMLCDTIFMSLGGHIIYDFTIPISTISYYLYIRSQEKHSKVE